MIEKVIARLSSFGYDNITANDQAMIDFEVEKVTWTVKNDCNVSAIPEGLMDIAVDMVCGHFLQTKKTTSPSDLSDLIDFDSTAIKEITAGDTKTVWDNSGVQSSEQRYDAFCNYLINYGRDEFSCYRRLRW